MHWIDWAITILLGANIIGGLAQGFFRTFCSLFGLIAGLVLAAWNYEIVAGQLYPFIHIEPLANILAFILMATIIMALCTFIGQALAKAFKLIGLGCLDRIAGAVFGFIQGATIVSIMIFVTLAFFPRAQWLESAELPHYFFGLCNASTIITPQKLANQVHETIGTLEQKSSKMLHIGGGAT